MSAADWLDDHEGSAPPSLLACMGDAVRAVADGTAAHERVDAAYATVDEHLAAASLHALRAALQQCDSRDAALPLLAADALVTAACEAAAEHGPTALDRLCRDMSPDRLQRLLDDHE